MKKENKATNKENYSAKEIEAFEVFKSCKSFNDIKLKASEVSIQTGHSERSVLAKLQSLAKDEKSGYTYYKKVYTPKGGGTTTPILKVELIEQLSDLIGCESEDLSSLEAATKASLLLVVGFLQKTLATKV